ncbi:MAG: replicative DNA helicase [Candidatus Dadabacteria bacterium]|nr:MAG: replicative DNA helicase [Candidatus Dadabacteria bacterium]
MSGSQAAVAPSKVPPHSLEAEVGVLGAVLLNNDVLPQVAELVDRDDFYRTGHRLIFEAMLDLSERGAPIDLVTLTEELRTKGVLEKAGGAAYVGSLTDQVPSARNAEHYARIVRERAVLRKLIWVATEIASEGYDPDADVEEYLDRAEQEIFKITQRKISPSFVRLRDVLKDAMAKVEELYERKELVTGVPTGFHDLDQLTAGLQPSDLIIVAGRPGMGKTSFVLNIAHYASVHENLPVGFFSLEMSREQLALRLLCAEARIDSHRLRRGMLKDSDFPKLARAAGVLAEAPFFIDDTPGISTLELRAKARRLKAEAGLELVIVDYLQLMRARGSYDVREQEISEISRSLKALAKELHVPVIALSQLNRGVESRSDKRPLLSDLRESGAIEQDADVILFIYRDDVYNKESADKGIAEIIVGKQRQGPTGTVKLAFLNEYTAFENLAKGYEEG